MYKILLLVIILAITGCSKLRPYRVDIEQGNIINQDDIAKLHTGLDKNQVASILSEPLLNEVFSDNIWSYAYTKQINGGKIEKERLILEFKNNKLIKITR